MNASVEDAVRNLPATRPQYVLLGILLLALFMDGLDLQLLSLVSPILVLQWKLQKSDLGAALSAGLLGMAIGSWIGGKIGDRVGRKTALVASVLWFAAATMGVGLSSSLSVMTVLRFAGGLGFGAAVPNAVALASEWLGPSLRLKAISLMSIGPPLGAMLGAVLLLGILTHMGWRGSFLLCGGVSILVAALIACLVPESPAFLLSQGRRVDVARLLKRWTGALVNPELLAINSAAGLVGAAPETRETDRVGQRFRWGSALAFFCTNYTAYGFSAWTPLLAAMNGLSLSGSLSAVFFFNGAAVCAAVSAGPLVALWGSKRLMTAGALCAGSGALLLTLILGPRHLALGSQSGVLLAVTAIILGAGTGTVLATIYSVIAAAYPPARRASGLGLGMMFGRGGGIISMFFGGSLMGALPQDASPYFAVMGIAVIGSLVGIGLMDKHLAAGPSGPDLQPTH